MRREKSTHMQVFWQESHLTILLMLFQNFEQNLIIHLHEPQNLQNRIRYSADVDTKKVHTTCIKAREIIVREPAVFSCVPNFVCALRF